MADYRSKSHSDKNMQIEPYFNPPSTNTTMAQNDYRSYSVSYISSSSSSHRNMQIEPYFAAPAPELKKGKTKNGSNSWGLNDPEFQRMRRVAGYKVYSVEGKVKGSFRKSFRWLRNRYSKVVYGWW